MLAELACSRSRVLAEPCSPGVAFSRGAACSRSSVFAEQRIRSARVCGGRSRSGVLAQPRGRGASVFAESACARRPRFCGAAGSPRSALPEPPSSRGSMLAEQRERGALCSRIYVLASAQARDAACSRSSVPAEQSSRSSVRAWQRAAEPCLRGARVFAEPCARGAACLQSREQRACRAGCMQSSVIAAQRAPRAVC